MPDKKEQNQTEVVEVRLTGILVAAGLVALLTVVAYIATARLQPAKMN